MEWLKSKTTVIAGGCLALFGLQGYGLMSMRNSLDNKLAAVQTELQTAQKQDSVKLSQLATDLDVVTKRMGITAQELTQAHALSEQLKKENKENAQTAQRLRKELASKADSKSVDEFRQEASNKLNEVQQDTATKIAGVNGDVKGVRSDLDATREDLANSKRDLNSLIAHNSTELAELRRKGEREYIEFDLRRNTKQAQRVGDILLQLKKTDVKRQKFDVTINSDDANILKKDRTVNEPITILVGRDRVRYELVVNYVDKDRVRGYLSTPKDKLIAGDIPTLRRLQ